MKVYVLCFNEYGWEEGEKDSYLVQGVFTKEDVARTYMAEQKTVNHHGMYEVKEIEVDKLANYGW